MHIEYAKPGQAVLEAYRRKCEESSKQLAEECIRRSPLLTLLRYLERHSAAHYEEGKK